MQFINQSSGYPKSIRTSLSSGRSRSTNKTQQSTILHDINSMISRLDQLQNAINRRQYETDEQLKGYKQLHNNEFDKENIRHPNNKLKLDDINRGRYVEDQKVLTFGHCNKSMEKPQKYNDKSNYLRLLEKKYKQK